MAWDFNDKEPIYIQIVNKMKNKILSGEYKPGDKIESVRELASIVGVNPNTMQKALTSMESLGIIVTQRTLGKFITEDSSIIKYLKNETVVEKVDLFLRELKNLGYTKDEIIDLINQSENKFTKPNNLEDLIKEENNGEFNITM